MNMTLCWLFLLVLNVLRCQAFPTDVYMQNPNNQATIGKDNSNLPMIKEQVAALTKRVQQLEQLDSNRRSLVYVSEDNTTASNSGLRQADPVIVGFTAVLNRKLISVPLGSTIIFDKVLYNAGSGYDETTGIFTCPISGVYQFALFVESLNTKTAEIHIVIDGNDDWVAAISEPKTNGEDDTGGNILVVHVVQGHRVWVQTYDTDNQDIYPYFTTFSGVLIQRT